ncbi:hypothetical protein MAPG_10917 [Magnaporthiopsis poae ATCC 64411]|uniref:AB hydrolase-1 domain-containing protein n=1 Tax=Magnaporthiopsis poae (strain ATCC 64411 / 73-15) TaxID=644358 RepID=A0A0C4EDV6_MAGP6|nr:hypothetical protein MAPG_10917 [Magnaporthiopsis poae ATCC 64411]
MPCKKTVALIWSLCVSVLAATVVPPSAWDYPYPWPVQFHNLTSQRMDMAMAYMDVAPATGAGATTSLNATSSTVVVLLHGKNFCGATWAETARVLSSRGYRIVVPDQIGFCKSSKPPAYQFSLPQLAANTRSLLTALGINRAVVVGHSMGGMLAARYALTYPDATERLVLTNPLGLEDWMGLGVPYRSIDELYGAELATTYDSIRAYQQATYYVNATWKPEYDVWVRMLVSLYQLPGVEGETFAFNMAQATDMVLTQPVVHAFGKIRARTLLLIGARDITAIGKQWSPPEVAAVLGNYRKLGKEARDAIPAAELVEFPDLGHSPQVQDPEAYHAALLGWLET